MLAAAHPDVAAETSGFGTSVGVWPTACALVEGLWPRPCGFEAGARSSSCLGIKRGTASPTLSDGRKIRGIAPGACAVRYVSASSLDCVAKSRRPGQH
jgi:hypothetical protein